MTSIQYKIFKVKINLKKKVRKFKYDLMSTSFKTVAKKVALQHSL